MDPGTEDCCCSVVKSCLTLCDPMDYSTPCFPVLLSPRVCANLCPLSEWCHPIILSSVALLSSSSQSFPASWSFPVSQFFRWCPKNWSFNFSISLSNEYSGLISFRVNWFDFLETMELSTVFSSTTIQRHQFIGAQPFLWSNSHIRTWLLEKP